MVVEGEKGTPPSELGQQGGPPSEVFQRECGEEDWAPPSEQVWEGLGKDRWEEEMEGEPVDEERVELVVEVVTEAFEDG